MSLKDLVGNRFYRLGSSGEVVGAIQLRLRDLGAPLRGTGYFGNATDTAVTSFQRSRGLLPDGVVGPVTAAALDMAAGGTMPAPFAESIELPLWLQAGIPLIGTKEVPGTANNKTIIDWAKEEGGDIAKEYTHDSIPFCSLFMNHLLTKSTLKGTETLWALDWNADLMQARIGRRWPGVKLPAIAVGAIAPMLRDGGGHVITVVGRDQHGNVMGLGSNQSDTTSIIPFPLSRLNKGFWWPDSVPLPKVMGFDRLPVVTSDGRVSHREA